MDEQGLRNDNGDNEFVGRSQEEIFAENEENNRNQENVNADQPKTTAMQNTVTGSNANKPIVKHPLSNSAPCRAYEAAELFRRRKEMKMKKIKEEEERLRRHKAKPMPNFKSVHARALSTVKDSGSVCVSPETPEVFRRGLAMKEKQQQKIKEHQLKLAERPPIISQSTKVLREEPFKPKLEPHQPIKIEPFRLQMTERLQHRKEFDEKYQRELAKKKEEEEKQLQAEEERRRQCLRKETTFKARPNPFKKETL